MDMRRWLLCFTVSLLFLTGCKQNLYKETRTEEVFGTVITFTLYGPDRAQLKQVISDSVLELVRLENIFSAKKEDSELSRLNAGAYGNTVKISEELADVIESGLYYNLLSQGALDISLGYLVDAWGIGTDHATIPQSGEILKYANQKGCDNIVFDREAGTVRFLSDRVKLDLGAIAKGYAANCIREIILGQNEKITGIIDFGGNIVAIGEKENGSAWNVGITDPGNPSSIFASVSVRDMCVVTSGTYERYFVKDEVRYHHILDPFTGYPADNGIASATIIGGDSMKCDALSTACFVLGLSKAMELIEKEDGMEAVFVDDDGKVYESSGMKQYELKMR